MAEYLSKDDISTSEYISRDEALKALHQYCTDCAISCDGVMCRACDHANAMDIISDMQAAGVQPVKRELVKIVDSDFMTQGYLTIEKFYSCPRCGETFGNVRFSRRSQLAEMYKFCYKCGQGLDWAETTKG